MHDETWIILDAKTSGQSSPLWVVEITAQKMKGWARDGEPFRILLNHNVPIDPAAQAAHGYTQEHMQKNGSDPSKAHDQFREYCGENPVVAYNLSFAWDRALLPEISRLGKPAAGRKGFCAMTLSRRTINETENYQLETLNKYFRLSTEAGRQERNDAEVLIKLLQEVIGPRLQKAGVSSFASVSEFSRRTPVTMCLEEILGASDQRTENPRQSNATPDTSKPSEDAHEILYDKWVNGTTRLCRQILADGKISEKEFHSLEHWLTECPFTHVYPLNVIAEKLESILCDGVVTPEELTLLKEDLNALALPP